MRLKKISDKGPVVKGWPLHKAAIFSKLSPEKISLLTPSLACVDSLSAVPDTGPSPATSARHVGHATSCAAHGAVFDYWQSHSQVSSNLSPAYSRLAMCILLWSPQNCHMTRISRNELQEMRHKEWNFYQSGVFQHLCKQLMSSQMS